MGEGIQELVKSWDAKSQAAQTYAIASEIYPFCRSITGDGLRQTFRALQRHVLLTIHEIPTGTRAYDWTVPNEWNVRDAYVKNSKGERVIDFQVSNLHLVNYSSPIRRKMRRPELAPHVFTLPETPELIPYRTSYYNETWGFCLAHRQWESMPDDEYEVCIDATLEPGNMSLAEFRKQGATDEEVVISAHSCHPSLANDNVSGIAVATSLAKSLSGLPLRYSYRFLWVPATIGTIAWLSLNESVVPSIKHGLVLSCVGDAGRLTYKRSRRGNAEIDRAVEAVLFGSGQEFEVRDFTPYGCDERQYCSPGFNIPVGCFMRTPNEEYAQNHTSADNLDFITADALGDSVHKLLKVIQVLEQNHRYINLNPKCEPQLGRRGLYGQTGGKGGRLFGEAIMWTWNLSDGEHSLLDIAERSKVEFAEIAQAAEVLTSAGLLRLS